MISLCFEQHPWAYRKFVGLSDTLFRSHVALLVRGWFVSMIVKQRRPLFWICLTLSSFGFVCFMLSFVSPFWYAKFPQSKNRFTSLGLWEVCFKEFMPDSIGNLMYTGCFYLYDPQIKPLWSIIFRSGLYSFVVDFLPSLVCGLPSISYVQPSHICLGGSCTCDTGVQSHFASRSSRRFVLDGNVQLDMYECSRFVYTLHHSITALPVRGWLLSYEQPPLMLPVRSPSTAGEQSSIYTQDVNIKSITSSSRFHHSVPAQGSHNRLHQVFAPQRLGVGTGTPEGESEHFLVSARQSKLQSSESSMWTADSSIQVARPMRNSRGPKRNNSKNLSKHVISAASIEEVDELPPENVQPHVQVQASEYITACLK
ncbi:uncharacterized protein DEA37_0001753 [Paragonimus westermani]|uniref:Uncharacterized protein n=1 Tax=Paragonimus westermani TaxID=34504 RepID=A0A5J4NBN3_9TREM|nr:uncharacterized protein DEA37_0001753 [Paragonimus westermani]